MEYDRSIEIEELDILLEKRGMDYICDVLKLDCFNYIIINVIVYRKLNEEEYLHKAYIDKTLDKCIEQFVHETKRILDSMQRKAIDAFVRHTNEEAGTA